MIKTPLITMINNSNINDNNGDFFRNLFKTQKVYKHKLSVEHKLYKLNLSYDRDYINNLSLYAFSRCSHEQKRILSKTHIHIVEQYVRYKYNLNVLRIFLLVKIIHYRYSNNYVVIYNKNRFEIFFCRNIIKSMYDYIRKCSYENFNICIFMDNDHIYDYVKNSYMIKPYINTR